MLFEIFTHIIFRASNKKRCLRVEKGLACRRYGRSSQAYCSFAVMDVNREMAMLTTRGLTLALPRSVLIAAERSHLDHLSVLHRINLCDFIADRV